MPEAMTAVKPGTKEHLLQAVEALDEERVSALSYYAAYLQAQEDAEEDEWFRANEETICAELDAAERGDVPSKTIQEIAAERGIDLGE
jgi:hypothetical protein